MVPILLKTIADRRLLLFHFGSELLVIRDSGTMVRLQDADVRFRARISIYFPSPPLEAVGFDLDVILVFGALLGHKKSSARASRMNLGMTTKHSKE
jgi:hypothetical protein